MLNEAALSIIDCLILADRPRRVKSCWIIRDTDEFLNTFSGLRKVNALELFTDDFTKMYTQIQHGVMKEAFRAACIEVTQFLATKFNVSTTDAWGQLTYADGTWSLATQPVNFFDRLLGDLDYILAQAFVAEEGTVKKQVIGLPMGIEPAPALANIFLWYHEKKWVTKLVAERGVDELLKAPYFGFQRTTRFIDDRMSTVPSNLMPQSDDYGIEIVNTAHGDEVVYLGIKAKLNDVIEFRARDKQDAFAFNLVRYPAADSNCPLHYRTGSIVGAMVRVFKLTSRLWVAMHDTWELLQYFTECKGYERSWLIAAMHKFMHRHLRPSVAKIFKQNIFEPFYTGSSTPGELVTGASKSLRPRPRTSTQVTDAQHHDDQSEGDSASGELYDKYIDEQLDAVLRTTSPPRMATAESQTMETMMVLESMASIATARTSPSCSVATTTRDAIVGARVEHVDTGTSPVANMSVLVDPEIDGVLSQLSAATADTNSSGRLTLVLRPTFNINHDQRVTNDNRHVDCSRHMSIGTVDHSSHDERQVTIGAIDKSDRRQIDVSRKLSIGSVDQGDHRAVSIGSIDRSDHRQIDVSRKMSIGSIDQSRPDQRQVNIGSIDRSDHRQIDVSRKMQIGSIDQSQDSRQYFDNRQVDNRQLLHQQDNRQIVNSDNRTLQVDNRQMTINHSTTASLLICDVTPLAGAAIAQTPQCQIDGTEVRIPVEEVNAIVRACAVPPEVAAAAFVLTGSTADAIARIKEAVLKARGSADGLPKVMIPRSRDNPKPIRPLEQVTDQQRLTIAARPYSEQDERRAKRLRADTDGVDPK